MIVANEARFTLVDSTESIIVVLPTIPTFTDSDTATSPLLTYVQ